MISLTYPFQQFPPNLVFIFSPVGAWQDFVYLLNVVLVAWLNFFHLQSCWCSTGLLFKCLMSDSRVDGSTWFFPSIFLSQWSGCNQSIFLFSMVWIQQVKVDQRKRWPILTDSSPVFSCSGQLKRILSSKPLINRRSRRRLSWALPVLKEGGSLGVEGGTGNMWSWAHVMQCM